MRFGENVNSPPSVPNSSLHQGKKVPLHSALIILDDCDDISVVADSSISVEDGGTLEDNVQDDQSTNIDVATQEVKAADTINSSSQPMVAPNIDDDLVHVDSHRYPHHTHCPPQRYDDFEKYQYAGRIF